MLKYDKWAILKRLQIFQWIFPTQIVAYVDFFFK